MDTIFIQLAVILFVAFVVSYVARLLNQPIIIGYIVAGIIISPFLVKIGATIEIINIFSQFGIAFLLFIVGLHLNPKVIKEIGISSLVVGLGQILLTFGAGFLVAWKLIGMDILTSSYIGVALAFSSTIIIMKLLSDKKQMDSLYGKIAIGVLIIQDIVAIGVLMFISSSLHKTSFNSFGFEGLIGGAVMIILLFLFGYLVLPKITRNVAKSQELLFLFSICWCFIVAALFTFVGFSMEIGALVAGVILSVSPYATEISSKIRPLRDFFIIVFFVILGLKMQISNVQSVIVNALIFSGIALIFKPLILMIFMKFFGYTKRTNFLTGITLGQISEFSLIVLGLGVAVGHIAPEILNTMVLTLIITILLSTYLVIYSNKLYSVLAKGLVIFEKKKIRKDRKIEKKYDAILFGYNRIGFSILNSLKKVKKKYLVVDFNPDTVAHLNKFRIPALYGDVFDLELLEDLPLDKIKLAISTIPDLETNKLLLESVRAVNKKAIVILRAHSIDEALELYKQDANYVLTPHFLGGEYVAKMIKHSGLDEKDYDKEKMKHIRMLEKVKAKGHRHPDVEAN
ncbi:sodium:proton exchanger [archaeon]|jgi:Kef-type K+ transport system membrane component KefB/Trk K+ transport system NAD-binding subunit|nr:sodium:proton exchanger [archaeon]